MSYAAVLARRNTGRWSSAVIHVVDYVRPKDGRPEGVVFVFDGGVLAEGATASMVLRDDEILSASFLTLEQATWSNSSVR